MSFSWETAINYAKLVKIAEDIAPDNNDADLKAKIASLGYSYLTTLFGNELATDINPHNGDCVSFGFLAVSATKELVVIIRGTDTIWEWLHDAAFLMVPAPFQSNAGLTEDGFTAIYKSLHIASGIAPLEAIRCYLSAGMASSVTICGHSLGGALATILGLDVAMNSEHPAPTVYTYASPRVGNHVFSALYNKTVTNSYRITNRADLVPKLPSRFPLPFEHVNTLEELVPPKDAINSTIACMHHLVNYLWLMGRLAGIETSAISQGCTG